MKKETPRRVPIINADTMEINASGAKMYMKCAKQYEYRYVHHIKDIPGIALLEGSAHHKALEVNNLHKMKKEQDLKPATLTELFVEDLRKRIESEEEVDWHDDSEDKVIDRAKTLHVRYYHDVAPQIRPQAVEQPFEKKAVVDGTPITVFGTIDLEIEPAVVDYKTSSKAWTQNDADNDFQMSLYAWGLNKKRVVIVNLIKKGNPQVTIIKSRRTSLHKMWALRVARDQASAIKSGQFPVTNPTNWWCSPKWCGYYARCRGKFE